MDLKERWILAAPGGVKGLQGFFPSSCQVGTTSFGWQRDTSACEVACEWRGIPLEEKKNEMQILSCDFSNPLDQILLG